MIRDHRVLITGALGFIGSHITENLMLENEILAIDNTVAKGNLEHLRQQYAGFEKRVKVVSADVRDSESLKKIIRDFQPEIIFHLASVTGVESVISRPYQTLETNMVGTYGLIKALHDLSSVRKVVFTSTSEVYGSMAFSRQEDGEVSLGPPFDPRWSYAASKLFSEHMLAAMDLEVGIPVAIVRLFNIYGPRQVGAGAIHQFIENAIANQPLAIYGDGSQIRSFCFISDCAEGLLLLAEKGRGVFNIGNPREPTSIYSLANLVKTVAESNSPVLFVGEPPFTDIKLRVPAIEKIRKLGFEPKVDLVTGIRQTLGFYREQPSRPTNLPKRSDIDAKSS